MKIDKYGQIILNELDLCKLYMQNTGIQIKNALIEQPIEFNSALELNSIPHCKTYIESNLSVNDFDKKNQSMWYMPQSYYDLDIAEWVLLACDNQPQIQRCAAELIRYQELNLFSLLQYLKYIVDTMRLNNIVWGVGRGSSVSSYVLYKIGVHKIDSMYYDLDYTEFLR